MATHSATAKASIGNAIKDDIEGGAGAGLLKFLNTAKTATYASLTLATPCGTVNGTTGVLTFDCTPSLSDSSASAGTATRARLCTSAGAVIVDDITVGTGTASDIDMSNNVFGAGDAVKISSLSYTPPS